MSSMIQLVDDDIDMVSGGGNSAVIQIGGDNGIVDVSLTQIDNSVTNVHGHDHHKK